MIRRNVIIRERDPRVVKWSLIAAACALLLGGYAELTMAGQAEDETPAAAVANDSVEPELPGIIIAS